MASFGKGARAPVLLAARASPLAVRGVATVPGGAAAAAATHGAYQIWGLGPAFESSTLYTALYTIAESSSTAVHALHEGSGLPWWATIVLTGLVVRASLSPFGVLAIRNAARGVAARDAVRAVYSAFGRASAAAKDSMTLSDKISLVLTTQRGVWAAQRRVGCRPWLSFLLPFTQIPVLLAAVLGARHSVLTGDESFEVEGLAWFTDLTAHDPYYVIPALAMALNYVSLEVMVPRKAAPAAGKAPSAPAPMNAAVFSESLVHGLRDVGHVALIVLLPFVADLPAGMFLLMSANSAWTIAYLSAVRTPAVQKVLLAGIPLPSGALDPGVAGSGEGSEVSKAGGSAGQGAAAGGATAVPSLRAGPAPVAPVVAAAAAAPPPSATERKAAAAGSSSSTVSLPPALAHFVHHMQMHPRFIYVGAAEDIDLKKEASWIAKIRASMRNDVPWLQGAASPFALAVAGGDRRVPWYDSPAFSAEGAAKSAATPAQRAPEMDGGIVAAAASALFISSWQSSNAVPVAGVAPRERMRVSIRAFLADREVPDEGKEGGSASSLSSKAGGERRGRDDSRPRGKASVALSPGPSAPAPGPLSWPAFALDDPLHILLPNPRPAEAKVTQPPILPHSFVGGIMGSGTQAVLQTVPQLPPRAQVEAAPTSGLAAAKGPSKQMATAGSRRRRGSAASAASPPRQALPLPSESQDGGGHGAPASQGEDDVVVGTNWVVRGLRWLRRAGAVRR